MLDDRSRKLNDARRNFFKRSGPFVSDVIDPLLDSVYATVGETTAYSNRERKVRQQ